MSKIKLTFLVASALSSFLINLPACANFIGFAFGEDRKAMEISCEYDPREVQEPNCNVIHIYDQVVKWNDRIFVYMAENAEGTTWWLDRTEPLEANGEIVTYMQMIPEDNFEILSIAVIEGNCENKTFIIRQIADFKRNGINISNESPYEKVTPLKGNIASNILNHVCKLSGM